MIKIQSISDIITNSSTEVFLNVTKESIEEAKKIFDHLVKTIDSSKTFEDIFEIKLSVNENEVNDILEDEAEEFEEMDKNLSIEEKAYLINDMYLDNGVLPAFEHIEIIAKDSKNSELANELENLLNMNVIQVKCVNCY